MHDAPRKPLGQCGLAHAGIAHVERVVLGTPAEHLDGALHFGRAPDERIDLAVACLLVEIDAIGIERLGAFLDGMLSGCVFVGAGDRGALLFAPGHLGDAVRDVVDRVVARHVLLLQEIDGVGFTFGKERDEHVGTGYLGPTARLDMQDGALNDTLEASRGFGFDGRIGH